MSSHRSSTHESQQEILLPGMVVLVAADGAVRRVADGLAFPNGMAVTADNSTLIVAESYAKKLTAFDIAASVASVEQAIAASGAHAENGASTTCW